MKMKRILILLILLIAVAGFTLSTIESAEAAKKTVKIKATGNNNIATSKSLGSGDRVATFWHGPRGGQFFSGNIVSIKVYKKGYYLSPRYIGMPAAQAKKYKMTSAKVFYKNNGRITTKTYKASSNIIHAVPPIGHRPIKATVYYKRK